MKRIPPKPRYETAEARESVAEKLNLPYSHTMQDWPWEVANPNDMDAYIKLYDTTTDEDELFVLMEIILQVTTEQTSPEAFKNHCKEVRQRLKKNFYVHESSIYYWCCWDLEDLEDCFQVSPLVREIWNKQKNSNNL